MSTLLYNPYRGGWKSHKNCLRGLWMTPDLIPTFYKLKTKVLIIQVNICINLGLHYYKVVNYSKTQNIHKKNIIKKYNVISNALENVSNY